MRLAGERRTAPSPARTPEWARQALEARAAELDSLWITTELVGGSRRRRAEHDAREERRRAAEVALAAELRDLADLPDTDLAWLLGHGWDPHHAGTPVGP